MDKKMNKDNEIWAKCILKSSYIDDDEVKHTVVTVEYNAPKFLLAQINTHKIMSKLAQSSRAVPTHKQAMHTLKNMYVPRYFLKNKPGMQATEYYSELQNNLLRGLWFLAGCFAVAFSAFLSYCGVHKQWANRPTEWCSYTKGIITATEWDNFFNQRLDESSQPEFQSLATEINYAINAAGVYWIDPLEGWHLPYVTGYDSSQHKDLESKLKCSVARVAGVSYRKLNMDIEQNMKVYNTKLSNQYPPHNSVFEMACKATDNPKLQANLKGFMQLRKLVENKSKM